MLFLVNPLRLLLPLHFPVLTDILPLCIPAPFSSLPVFTRVLPLRDFPFPLLSMLLLVHSLCLSHLLLFPSSCSSFLSALSSPLPMLLLAHPLCLPHPLLFLCCFLFIFSFPSPPLPLWFLLILFVFFCSSRFLVSSFHHLYLFHLLSLLGPTGSDLMYVMFTGTSFHW